MSPEERQALEAEIVKCRSDLARFNETVLARNKPDGQGNRGYWARQREICRSFLKYPATYATTGNMVGKSFVDAGIIIGYLLTHPNSLVLATAPSQVQLEEVLWKEVERAYKGSRVPLGGRLLRSPLKIDFGGGWQALAYSTTKVERLSGHHGSDVGAVLDEASGIAEEIWEAFSGVNPSNLLATGNPLWAHGAFFERCQQGSNALQNIIQVSSLESPHIQLPRSPWGLADATWLAKAINDYGENSPWWRTHVLGLFPTDDANQVVPGEWWDLAGKTVHRPGGQRYLSIDLAEGNGGDDVVLIVRDDNGIMAREASNRWNFETTATKASLLTQRFYIEPHHVSFDIGGPGADFANRLAAVGLGAARPYRGGVPCTGDAEKKYHNRRAMGAWRLRQRLDPKRTVTLPSGVQVPQVPFAIPPEIARVMRHEIVNLRHTYDERGRIQLELAEDFRKRLKRSPNDADALGQSFAVFGG